MGRKLINILTPYSYSSSFNKINYAALKKHCKLKPSFQMRKPRNLHNEVESDPCPGGPRLWLLGGRRYSCKGPCTVFIVYIPSLDTKCTNKTSKRKLFPTLNPSNFDCSKYFSAGIF